MYLIFHCDIYIIKLLKKKKSFCDDYELLNFMRFGKVHRRHVVRMTITIKTITTTTMYVTTNYFNFSF